MSEKKPICGILAGEPEIIGERCADGQSVSGGIEECTYLADAIWNALRATSPAQTAPQPVSSALADVIAERRRQIAVEGWTPEHDDEHGRGEMALAAACYARHAIVPPALSDVPATWPWGASWWKPGDPRRMLVKAAALILAEIERLDRAAARGGAGDE